MATRPNTEERSFGADRERQRDISTENARSAQPSNGENLARESSATESGSTQRGRSNRAVPNEHQARQNEQRDKTNNPGMTHRGVGDHHRQRRIEG